MRVAVVTWSRRRVGGVEEYLAGVIPALRTAGNEVMLWYEADEPAYRDPIPVPHDVPVIGVEHLGIDAALSALSEWKPDVVYVQGLRDVDLEARILDTAPSVLFVHNYVGMCISGSKTFTRPTVIPCDRRFGWPCLLHYFPHGCGGRSPVTMWREFRRRQDQLSVCHRFNVVLTHSDHMRRELTKHGLSAETVVFPVPSPAQGLATRDQGRWRLLFVGRLDFLKGGLCLLDALPKLTAALDRPVRLIFAGDGPDRLRWEARAREVQSREPRVDISFTGWLPQARLGELLDDTDLLVVPSLWPEPFGSVGPAAGYHAVPAAAFAVGGIPDWLRDGVNGHLAPGDPPTAAGLAEAILRCLGDESHHAELRRGARECATRFDMDQHLRQLLRVFRRVTAAHPKPVSAAGPPEG